MPATHWSDGTKNLTPSTRSIRMLREDGWLADNVERSIGKVRFDAFGIGDILACLAEPPTILLIQATSAPALANRRTKVQSSPALLDWIHSGGQFELHAWKIKDRKAMVFRQRMSMASQYAVCDWTDISWRTLDTCSKSPKSELQSHLQE